MSIDDIFNRCIPITESGCWVWFDGYVSKNGYGRLSAGELVHRRSYQLAKGHVPKGMDLDHKCRVRCCCNPDHLEAVTRSENNRRSPLMGKHNLRKTHCPRGHVLSGDNLYIRREGWRVCRICNGDWRARHAL